MMSWNSQQVLLSGQASPCHPPCMSSQCPGSPSNGKKASVETGMRVLVGACKNAAASGVLKLLQ